jgi:hypothetical protein
MRESRRLVYFAVSMALSFGTFDRTCAFAQAVWIGRHVRESQLKTGKSLVLLVLKAVVAHGGATLLAGRESTRRSGYSVRFATWLPK